MDLFDRIMELSRCGYFCGQILAILLLETLGEEDPGFVRAMGGLNGGVGFSGDVCGFVYVPEELALGKVLSVETALADK